MMQKIAIVWILPMPTWVVQVCPTAPFKRNYVFHLSRNECGTVVLPENESTSKAIGIFGTEQFTHPQGYGSSLRFGGRYDDTSCCLGKRRDRSFVCAIDALDFRRGGSGFQYTKGNIA